MSCHDEVTIFLDLIDIQYGESTSIWPVLISATLLTHEIFRRQQPPAPTPTVLGPSVAPAHGGVGDAGPAAAAASAKVAERAGARVAAGGPLGQGKGRGGSSRVARLGSALDDVDTRSHGSRAAGGVATRARSGEKVDAE